MRDATPTPLPHDPVLPQLARAVDGGAMAAVFAELLQPQGLQVAGCAVERIKYRPRRNCTLSYRLALRDPRDGRAWDQRVAARLCGGDGERRALRAAAAPLVPTPAGPALRLLPELDLLTWWWPNDARLAAPQVLADDERLRRELLPALLPALSGRADATLLAHRVEIVQYVPEQRLTARVAVRWRDGDGAEANRLVYAKASREPDGAVAHARLAALQASPGWRSGRLRTPAALQWQAQAGLHWQEALPGMPWLELDATRQAALAPRLGGQLAALHAVEVPAERVLDEATLRARLADVQTVLAEALPASRADLHQATERLRAGVGTIAALPPATLHGDLHQRNILVDGGQPALIDLDGLRRGPAVLELGAWLAEGLYRALLDGNGPRRDLLAWHALLAGYRAAGGIAIEPHQLAWATAWALLTQRAWRCVVNLKPGRFAIAPMLVALAAGLDARWLAGAPMAEAA